MTSGCAWTSTNTARVTVGAAGLATGVAGGTADLNAVYNGITGVTHVNVFTPNPSPVPPLSESVAYQVDYAHSGRATVGASGPTLPPLSHWSTTLNGLISYPVIAGGRVFVMTNVNGTAGDYGTSLYALDETTGTVLWGPTPIPATFSLWAGHAYDHGTIFVVNYNGLVRTFDAATGTEGWSLQLPTSTVTAPPTAADGVLYVDASTKLFAIDESNGGILWQALVQSGDISSPTVTPNAVFVSFPCQVFAYDPLVGTPVWRYDGPCGGGGGKTTVYANGKLYVRDAAAIVGGPGQQEVYDAATGNQLRTFTAGPIPAFSATTGFFLANGTLSAIDQTSLNTLWTFTGDGALSSAPLVIDSIVVIGSTSGNVYALNAANGSVVWTTAIASAIYGPDEQNVSQPLTGLGAGDGYLVVPAATVLHGWRLVP